MCALNMRILNTRPSPCIAPGLPGRLKRRQHLMQTASRAEVAVRASDQVLDNITTESHPRPAQAGPAQQTGRTLVLAVDGTEDSTQACSWLVRNFCRSGDTVHLCYVLCNERSVPTSLGSSGNRDVLDTMDEDFGADKRRDYVSRKQQEVQNMLTSKFVPLLNCGQVSYRIDIRVANGRRGAATIGEQIVSHAHNMKADALIIASHGAGLLADYGSVARYVVQHFQSAVVLLPPGVDMLEQRDSQAVCLAINSVAELQDTAWWALRSIYLPQDKLHVVHVKEDRLKVGSATDQVSIMLGLSEQVRKHHVKDMELQHLPQDFTKSGDARNQAAADSVLSQVYTNEDRLLVMVNYASQGMMQEMMLGSLAMHCTRYSRVPLVLVPPGISFS